MKLTINRVTNTENFLYYKLYIHKMVFEIRYLKCKLNRIFLYCVTTCNLVGEKMHQPLYSVDYHLFRLTILF